MSKLPKEYNGIMVEGASEKAIMDLLINNNKLIFPFRSIIQSSDGTTVQDYLNELDYANNFLSHGFNKPVNIHVVLDSTNRKFKKLESNRLISTVRYYITREEIEAIHLYKHTEWLEGYMTFKNNKSNRKGGSKQIKPSTFFKQELGIKNIKTYDYIYKLWEDDIDGLIKAIDNVKTDMAKRQKLKSGQNYLADIIKHDYQ